MLVEKNLQSYSFIDLKKLLIYWYHSFLFHRQYKISLSIFLFYWFCLLAGSLIKKLNETLIHSLFLFLFLPSPSSLPPSLLRNLCWPASSIHFQPYFNTYPDCPLLWEVFSHPVLVTGPSLFTWNILSTLCPALILSVWERNKEFWVNKTTPYVGSERRNCSGMDRRSRGGDWCYRVQGLVKHLVNLLITLLAPSPASHL